MDLAFVTMAVTTTLALLRDPVFGSQTGLQLGRDLLWSSRIGAFDQTEGAAFIVDRGNGDLRCLAWPRTYENARATFHGTIPPGTVAIIHTHPNARPWPSSDDEHEAHRLGLAIYALTPMAVTKAVPTQNKPVLVHRGPWADPRPRGHPCQLIDPSR